MGSRFRRRDAKGCSNCSVLRLNLASGRDSGYDARPVTDATDLDALRSAIDAVDSEILSLVARRIGLVLRIADYKRSRDMPVYDPTRERAVIDRLIGVAPENLDAQVIRRIFERIIDESRRIEQHEASKA